MIRIGLQTGSNPNRYKLMQGKNQPSNLTLKKRLIVFALLCLAFIVVLPGSALQAQNISSGLKAYWNMDAVSGTTILDQSGNGFNGTLSGNAIISTSGKAGGCLEMPARSDGMMLATNLAWQPAAPAYAFSVSFWMNPYSNSDYANQLASQSGWGGFVFHSDPSAAFHVGTNQASHITSFGGISELNVWKHYVFTFSNGTGNFYVDGYLAVTKTGMSAPVNWNGFRIGHNTDPKATLHGKIDEVRIYDRVITTQEIDMLRAYPNASLSCVWSSAPVDTDWNNPANWNTGTVPTQYDNVTVNSCTTCPVLSSNVNLVNLTVNTNGKLNIGAYTLAITNALNFNGAQISSASGKLAGSLPNLNNSQFTGAITINKTRIGILTGSYTNGNTFNDKVTFLLSYIPQYTRWYIGNGTKNTYLSDVVLELAGAPGGYYNNISFSSGQPTEIKGNLTVINGGGSDNSLITLDNVKCHQSTTVLMPGPLAGNVVFSYNMDFMGPFTVNLANLTTGHPKLQFNPAAGNQQVFRKAVTFTATNNGTWPSPTINFGDCTTGTVRFEPDAELSFSGAARWLVTLCRATLAATASKRVLTLPAGPAYNTSSYLYLYATTFLGKTDINTPNMLLQGNVFNDETTITRTATGAVANSNPGGNVFSKKVRIINNAPAGTSIQMATSADDIIQQTQ